MNKTSYTAFKTCREATYKPEIKKAKGFTHIKSKVGGYIDGFEPHESIQEPSPRKIASLREARPVELLRGDPGIQALQIKTQNL